MKYPHEYRSNSQFLRVEKVRIPPGGMKWAFPFQRLFAGRVVCCAASPKPLPRLADQSATLSDTFFCLQISAAGWYS